MQSLSAAQLVGVWERGVGQSSLDRALTMLADAYPEMTRAELAALSVGLSSTIPGFRACYRAVAG